MHDAGPPAAAAAAAGFFVVFMCAIQILFMLFIFAMMGFWIWMLVDVLTKCPERDNKKLTWALVVALTGAIGAAIYYFVQRPKNALESQPPPAPSPPK